VLRLKDLWGRSVSEKVIGLGGKILEELEGPRGGRASVPGARKNRANLQNHYSISVLFVKELMISGLDKTR
jgi:hypothetical protein